MTEFQIICGDCYQEISKLEDKSIDLVVTSPPYNVKIKYNQYKDNLSDLDYIYWLYKIFLLLKSNKLKDDGQIFLNLGFSCTNPSLPLKVASELSHSFEIQNTIIWVKSISVDDITKGHYTPLNSDRFLNNNFEYIFHLTKDGNQDIDRLRIGVPFSDKSNIKRRNHDLDLHCNGNVWFEPYPTRQEKLDHPATFPLIIPEKCIKMSGKKDFVILDPFAGIFNTLLAAKNLNAKKAIGIEIDKKYCEIGKKRLGII